MKQHIENALKGAALGAINALLLPCAVSPVVSEQAASLVLPAILCLGLCAAIPIGVVMGVIAGALRTNRLLVLEVIALAAIPIVGAVTLGSDWYGPSFRSLAMMAAGPTAIVVVILERWTVPTRTVARALGLVARSSSAQRTACTTTPTRG